MKTINIQSAEHYDWGNNCDGWHLVKNNLLSVIQECVPPGSMEVRHYHKHAHQFFYVLSGLATIEANGNEFHLKAGDGLEIAPETPHRFKNKSDEDVLFLVISTPNSHEDRVTA